MKIKASPSDRVFNVVNFLIAAFVLLITLYPFLYVVSASLSDPSALNRGEVWLFPKGINLEAYKTVLKNHELWVDYYNTIWYVVVGTLFNIVFTTLLAYPLSRRNMVGRNVITILVAFTMFFSGGLVPVYLMVKNLHLLDTRWALVFPCLINTWNMIIMRTFFVSIPESLHEAAVIDGANEFQILLKIVIALSKPVLAVMVLFYAVAHWNTYFSALLYLNNESYYPLQMFLRKIIVQFDMTSMTGGMGSDPMVQPIGESIRYATIIVSTLPILCVYPFLQKYFAAGVMIGAIKE
jgi:putative aldouronate transport system permease protein